MKRSKYYDKATVSTKNLRTRIESIFKVFRKLRVHPNAGAVPTNSELEPDIYCQWILGGNCKPSWKVSPLLKLRSDSTLLDEDISIVQESSVEDESSDKEEERRDEQTVMNTEAVDCFKKSLTWMERQNNVALFNCSSSVEWWSLRHAHTVANWNNLIYFRILG